MRTRFIIALLSAAALIPAAANAQSRHHNSDRGSHHSNGQSGHSNGSDHSGHAQRGGDHATRRAAPAESQASFAARQSRATPRGHSQADRQHYDRNRGQQRYRADDRGRQAYQRNARRYDPRHYDNREAYNRDWRSNRRYDWRDYRTHNRGAYHLPRYYAPRGWGYGYRRFSIGYRLNSYLFGSNYWISDPYDYRLPPAYGPYRWVRYYDDALLVDIRTGVVVDTVYGIFW